MARKTHKLTDLTIRKLAKKGLHGDGGNLFLRITETGTKGWVFRYKRGRRDDGAKKVYDLGMGGYPDLSLTGARAKAAEFRGMLAVGVNPAEVRRNEHAPAGAPEAKRVVNFTEATKRFIAAREAGWRNEKHRQQWRNTLEQYAFPFIGDMDVAAIGINDVLRVLEPIWTEKPETASRVRGRIESILDWSTVRHLRQGDNPAVWRGRLSHLLPARNKTRTVRHHPALPWRDMPAFMAELRANECSSSRAMQFTILTCARTVEAVEAEWKEIDREVGVWTVPKDRMKAGREHRVPISMAAEDLIGALPRFEQARYLFPGGRIGERPLSNMAMLELVRGMRPGLTVHGFRSTFRDWVAEATAFPRELAEAALAHVVGNATERAYQRGDLFEKRRELMEAWAAFCGSDPAP